VQPFLFNLFNDKHIITLPQPFRYVLAKLISTFRTKKSKKIYEQMGGKSPILQETKEQCKKLEEYLNINCSINRDLKYDVIPMMRYWHPMTKQVIEQIENENYDNIILLPLYPHFSTTTTLSSFRDWFKNVKKMPKTNIICCYYDHPGFIDAHAALLRDTLEDVRTTKIIRILFSAHSIPQHISDKGDPYKQQIEKSVEEIIKKTNIDKLDNIRYTICYQSKVGRMKWLEPDIKSAILESGKRNEAVVVVPISFTSEHSETLVELDIEYADLARENNIDYYRVPTVRTHQLFIKTLASLVVSLLQKYYEKILQTSNLKPYSEEIKMRSCSAKMCCKRLKLFD
jgi:ferrochelatase